MEEEEFEDVETQLRTRLLFLLYLIANNDKKWKDYLTVEAIWQRDKRIPRAVLVLPSSSPWAKL